MAYLFAELNYVGGFSGRRVIIIDEADSLENSLYQFISLNLSRRQLQKYDIDLPDYKTVSTDNGLVDWQRWGVKTYTELSAELAKHNRLAENYTGEEDDYDLLAQSIERLEGLTRKLKIFNTYLDRSWLLETRTDNWGSEVYHFRPLWLNPGLTEHFLWSHADKFVLMSATFPLLPVLSKTLGIPLTETDQVSLPSTFDPSRRRVIVRPVANLTARTMATETPKVVKAIKKIIDSHPNEKGLIHTVSYPLNSEIMKIKSPRLITHNSKDKIEVLEFFKQSKDPLIFVSPSSERGISLDADLCRFIILVKAPFLSLGDKAVKLRVYSSQVGQLWYQSDMALTCVQATGRGVRSSTDYCVSYLLDEQIARCFRTKPILLPGWFRDAVEFDYED